MLNPLFHKRLRMLHYNSQAINGAYITMITTGRRPSRFIAVLAVVLLTAGCANMPKDQAAPDEDPLGPINRVIYGFNSVVDGLILRPIASIYRGIVPEKGREMISNALENLYTPVTVANSVLQADPNNAFAGFWRFTLNSTVGMGGLFDVASEAGLKMRTTDFGQTLAIYGMDSGPYVVLPIIGPSTARDSVGRLADALMNPFNYIDEGFSYSVWAGKAVDYRANNMKLLDDIYASSVDPYATFRSGYTQKRASDIRRAKTERAASQEKAGF